MGQESTLRQHSRPQCIRVWRRKGANFQLRTRTHEQEMRAGMQQATHRERYTSTPAVYCCTATYTPVNMMPGAARLQQVIVRAGLGHTPTHVRLPKIRLFIIIFAVCYPRCGLLGSVMVATEQ